MGTVFKPLLLHSFKNEQDRTIAAGHRYNVVFIDKTMTITVNDKPKEVPEGCTVEALCAIVGIPSDSPVAVAVGMDVVERERWQTTELKENEKVTIIGAVCGG